MSTPVNHDTPTLLLGDNLPHLRALPDGSVQCCVTSPPYFGLRDYGTAKWEGGDPDCPHEPRRWDGPKQTQGAMSGHASKADRLNRRLCQCGAVRVDEQIGLEKTPAEYVAKIVEVFREVRRVLADDGTLWLNLGDSYAANRTYQVPSTKGGPKHSPAQGSSTNNRVPEGLKPKDLIGIPWMVAFALRDDGWYLRQDIIWHKPNPMPESVRDRCTKAHEYLFLLTKSPKYYFDHDANQVPASSRFTKDPRHKTGSNHDNWPGKDYAAAGAQNPKGPHRMFGKGPDVVTANRRSVWSITTKPFKGAHFATFPQDLVEPCILAGSRPGDIVLDPHLGSGTTGIVAAKHNRRFIGIELSPEYLAIAQQRMGVVTSTTPHFEIE